MTDDRMTELQASNCGFKRWAACDAPVKEEASHIRAPWAAHAGEGLGGIRTGDFLKSRGAEQMGNAGDSGHEMDQAYRYTMHDGLAIQPSNFCTCTAPVSYLFFLGDSTFFGRPSVLF